MDEATRSFSIYYAEVSRTAPVEDASEERRLIAAWQRKKDTKARDTLIQSHLRFVIKMAKKRASNLDKLQDLIAAGNIGLLKAIDRFELKNRTRFLTYAGWWIQEEMFREQYATSSLVHVPTHRQKAQRKRIKEYNQALVTHGPTSKKAQNLQPGPTEGRTVPMDDLYLLPDENVATHPAHYDHLSANSQLRHVVSTLPLREQTVLNLYFGIKDTARNFVQIASMLGMSPERVRQIKINGMSLLEGLLREKHSLHSVCDAY